MCCTSSPPSRWSPSWSSGSVRRAATRPKHARPRRSTSSRPSSSSRARPRRSPRCTSSRTRSSTSGFDKQVAALEGHPIVINKWASWCRPCRAEFPIFQQVATERGKEVAFLGVNAGDKRPAAEKFLGERPLPYPSYEDPDEDIAEELKAAKFFPMTIFVDADGKTAFVKAGEYTSRAELEADIDKYL